MRQLSLSLEVAGLIRILEYNIFGIKKTAHVRCNEFSAYDSHHHDRSRKNATISANKLVGENSPRETPELSI